MTCRCAASRRTEERCLKSTTARCPRGGSGPRGSQLLDGILENYKPALDELSFELAELEQEVVRNPIAGDVQQDHQLKKEVFASAQIIGPQREVLAPLRRGEFKLIPAASCAIIATFYAAFFTSGNWRRVITDSLTGLLHVYLSMSSNQTGEW